jgi:hypothetical protein
VGVNPLVRSFFATLKSELADRFDRSVEAKMELFDYVEVLYNGDAAIRRSARSVRLPCSDAPGRCRPDGMSSS